MYKNKRIKIVDLLRSEEFDSSVTVKGWIRNRRVSKNVAFLAVNDGSTVSNLQIVINNPADELMSKCSVGSSVSVDGCWAKSQGDKQLGELIADNLVVTGFADPEEYPLQPKKHSLEFLREIAHLRFRTNTFGAIFRIRHSMAYAIHKFFNDKGFVYINTPIITASDCEGAGEMFRVTTFDISNPPRKEDGSVDFAQDFFGRDTKLTVSGQLEGELAATALAEIYTFGPTFRAENSNTTRHLAEFWMVEPEMAFYDITDNMDLAEEMLKYLVKYALDNCKNDLEFLDKRLADEEKEKPQHQRSAMGLIEKLEFVLANDFARVTYTEAIDILVNSNHNKKKKFKYPVDGWGIDLQSEHERFLVEQHFKKPVILTDYPKDIKAFYMKQNDDGKTVRAMDVLFPQIGEIIGGSEREADYNKLITRMQEVHVPEKEMYWYLDTRRFGTVEHSGFGLGFERLILFVTGMTNIRDVIAFPRTPGNADF
jgi:asparaginyl-tRNA synthetase